MCFHSPPPVSSNSHKFDLRFTVMQHARIMLVLVSLIGPSESTKACCSWKAIFARKGLSIMRRYLSQVCGLNILVLQQPFYLLANPNVGGGQEGRRQHGRLGRHSACGEGAGLEGQVRCARHVHPPMAVGHKVPPRI